MDEAMTITPMPQPLFVNVLQPSVPVTPAVPPSKVRKARNQSEKAPSVGEAVNQTPEPEQSAADLSAPEGMPAPATEVAQAIEAVEAAGDATGKEMAATQQGPDVQAAHSTWPPDTRLSYSVKGYYRGDFYGWGQVQWQHSEGRYQVQLDARLALLFTGTLISQGELKQEGLQPRVFEERGMGRARRLTMEDGIVTFHDGSTQIQPIGAQDTASQFVELSHRFSTGRQALEVGAVVPVWLVRPREMYLWTYDVVALEGLHLGDLGEVAAYHLKPRPLENPRGPINAELWFAPSLQYLPVRIRINLGGDNYAEFSVKRIEQGQSGVNGHP